MSQVSKYPLDPIMRKSVEKNFGWLIASLKKDEEVSLFIKDFLTKTERIMLAKRLAIALLLLKGYGYTDIQQLIKVSFSTISKIDTVLENSRGYKMAMEKIAKRRELEEFWKGVHEFIHVVGKGYKVYG